MSALGLTARAVLRDRFTPPELERLAATPYPRVLREARERRAAALLASGWRETLESLRETPVIVTLHAFSVEQEELAGQPHAAPWDGSLDG
jgi:hypothetical protein